MSERTRNRLYVLAAGILAVAVSLLVLNSPTEADRVETIGTSIKCPVCQGESIANSPSTMARDMMALVRERVAEGRSDQEIVDELLGSYSGAVLLDPPVSGATLFLWLAPALALVSGAIVIVWWERHPGEETTERPTSKTRSRRRALVGGLILAGSFAAIVVVAGFFLQEDSPGTASGVAGLAGQDLEDVSNETMEAVIAANLDNPQISGMRLALAERYFDEGDFQSAFPHYLAVAQSTASSEPQAVTALVRLGWMAWTGNQEVELAIEMLDQALAIDPDSSTARYLKGQVLWCGANEPGEAEQLFTQVIDNGDLPAGSLELVEEDLNAVRTGESCT